VILEDVFIVSNVPDRVGDGEEDVRLVLNRDFVEREGDRLARHPSGPRDEYGVAGVVVVAIREDRGLSRDAWGRDRCLYGEEEEGEE
jgi:hypothetical protein